MTNRVHCDEYRLLQLARDTNVSRHEGRTKLFFHHTGNVTAYWYMCWSQSTHAMWCCSSRKVRLRKIQSRMRDLDVSMEMEP